MLRRRAVLRLVLEIQSGPEGHKTWAFKERICANDRSLRRILLHASVDSAGGIGSRVATWWFRASAVFEYAMSRSTYPFLGDLLELGLLLDLPLFFFFRGIVRMNYADLVGASGDLPWGGRMIVVVLMVREQRKPQGGRCGLNMYLSRYFQIHTYMSLLAFLSFMTGGLGQSRSLGFPAVESYTVTNAQTTLLLISRLLVFRSETKIRCSVLPHERPNYISTISRTMYQQQQNNGIEETNIQRIRPALSAACLYRTMAS